MSWTAYNCLLQLILTDDCYRYFIATHPTTQHRHLYKTSSRRDSSSQPNMPECLSCQLPGPACSNNQIEMSPERSFFIQNCAGSGLPFSRIIQTQSLAVVLVLDTNERLRDNMAQFSLPQVQEISSPSVSNSVKRFLPPGYRETDEFTFPLLVHL